LPEIQERVYVKVCTTLESTWGVPNSTIKLMNQIYGETEGFFTTTFHSTMPSPAIPAKYGFELFHPIVDPEGPVDKSDEAWDGYGQWVNHKIGGAPYNRTVGPVIDELRGLLQHGYEVLLQLNEPSWNIRDPQQQDDFPDEERQGGGPMDWLFNNDDFAILIHPRTMDIRYLWGG